MALDNLQPRRPQRLQPAEPVDRVSAADRICYAIIIVGGLLILGRVAAHFILEALS